MLCGLMESAGCGRPDSYFRRESMADFARDLGVPDGGDPDSVVFTRRYLEAVLAEGKAGTEIFGLRIMFESLGELSDRLGKIFPNVERMPDRLEKAFGRSLYVHLSREDKVAQAVSLLKAMQTGLWHVAPDGAELERTTPHRDAAYDSGVIGSLVDKLTDQDEAWRSWFATHGIEPVRVTYDDLSRDPRAGLRAVLAGLGMRTSLASGVEPCTARLADEQSGDWIARFRTDLGIS